MTPYDEKNSSMKKIMLFEGDIETQGYFSNPYSLSWSERAVTGSTGLGSNK